MPMKPAFDPVLALSEDRRTVSAAGPYDVQDGDTDAYFWIRISQGEVEAIATHDQEEDDIAARVAQGVNRPSRSGLGSGRPGAARRREGK